MRSLAARLSIMTNEERKELKMEIRECLGTIGLNLKTLHKMRKLDNLVCEVQLFCLAGISGLPLFAPRITPSFRSFFLLFRDRSVVVEIVVHFCCRF